MRNLFTHGIRSFPHPYEKFRALQFWKRQHLVDVVEPSIFKQEGSKLGKAGIGAPKGNLIQVMLTSCLKQDSCSTFLTTTVSCT